MKYARIVLLLLAGAGSLAGQSASETAGKALQTLGGPVALARWGNFEAEGQLINPNGSVLGAFQQVRLQQKQWARGIVRYGNETFTVIEAYDGQNSWTDFAGEVSDASSWNNEVKNQHGVDWLGDPEVAWKPVRESEIDGRKVLGLEGEKKGKQTTFWLDPETCQVIEISYKDIFISENEIKEVQEMRLRYGDYQTVAGAPFPMLQSTFTDGKKGMEMRYEKIVFNPSVSPAKFQRPSQKVDLRYREEQLD